jgi:hypothetical protein
MVVKSRTKKGGPKAAPPQSAYNGTYAAIDRGGLSSQQYAVEVSTR